MPKAPARLCSRPGCAGIIRNAVCGKCGPFRRRESDRKRPPWKDRLYGWRWKRKARQHLREHPLCATCEAQGKAVAATVVDHVIPHKGNEAAFWGGELQSLCTRHHNEKTGRGE